MPVQVEQFYLGCLAHASYLVGSEGIAAVIDPQRDVEIYIETAERLGLKIEHIIETHLHADFVSGHRELAQRTGATIYLGDGSGAAFPHQSVKDGDSIHFGRCVFSFLQTPGHTTESVCAVMTDLERSDRPCAVFTGDTLFVGDVGRPDLSPNHTPQQLAAMLYRSIREKLLALPGDTEVFPAHGAGSLCGRQMSSERSSSIGKERRTNYALQAKSCEEFVQLLTEGMPPRPEYFGRDVELNRQGAAPLDELPQLEPLPAAEVLRLQAEGAVVLDTRPVAQFASGHVPGSLHIALSGQFASWAGRIVGLDTSLILVGDDPDHVREAQVRLARVGMERVAGYLEDGISGWIRSGRPAEPLPQISAHDFAALLENEAGQVTILDVREASEVAAGAMDDSVRIPLAQLAGRVREVRPGRLLVVHCKSGYRSSIASSILRRAGFAEVANLSGGFDAWKSAMQPVR